MYDMSCQRIVSVYFLPRYHKGTDVWGKIWHERHAELMVVASEAVLPLAIAAIASTGGAHNSEHARCENTFAAANDMSMSKLSSGVKFNVYGAIDIRVYTLYMYTYIMYMLKH